MTTRSGVPDLRRRAAIRRLGAVAALVAFAFAWVAFAPDVLAVDGEDLSARAEVSLSPLTASKKGGLFETTAMVRNVSDAPLFGPVSLVVTGLDGTGISLAGAAGRTPSGEPWVPVPVPREGLAPGKSSKGVVLRFAGAASADFTFGHAVFGFAAEPEEPLPVLPGVDVSLSASVLRPGERLDASWKVVGRSTARTRLEFRVRAPGGDANVPGKQWIHHGLGPATGPVSWLTKKGTWSPARSLRRSAGSGRVKLVLPTNAAGAWSVDVRLVDRKSGETLLSGSGDVLVSGEPGIHLRLNRPIANGLDVVRATLTTTAGTSPRPVRVLAWLVRPDGSQVGLPGLVPGQIDVHRGTSRNDEIRLLDTAFGSDAQGAYQVQVRLFDGTTRELLARASAGFEVSDATASLTGVVRAADGTPFDGTAATLAAVEALDVDDLAVTAGAPIDGSGGYSMTLDAGRYVVSAKVLGADGVHRAASATLVEIDAAGTAQALDLDAEAPLSPGGKK